MSVKPPLWFPGRNPDTMDLWRGCVGYWPMWEGAGERIADLSGRGNTGVLTGMDPMTDWVAAKTGYVLDFDGADDYVVAGPAGDFAYTDPFSVVILAKPATAPGFFAAIGKMNLVDYDGWFISTGGGGHRDKITFLIGWAVADRAMIRGPAGSWVIGTWRHIVATNNGSATAAGMRLYQDGLLLATSVEEDDPPGDALTDEPLNIGARAGGNGPFPGQIALAGLWDRVLDPGEILALAADPFCMICPPDFAPWWVAATRRVWRLQHVH